ncbi:MAG: Ribosomal-protein-alanine N-acetyltransferase [Herbinix sp.]|nr:Ribosomal-protein-alanine N-acetyltransferase [Herbinix sp.]
MQKVYETDRLILRSLTYEDASLVLSFYEDNRTLFEPWEPKRGDNFYTLSYQKASLTAEYNQITEGKLLRYWVFLKDNPEEIIGSICFQNLLGEPYHSCCLGYKFSHIYQHQGYALESISKSIDLIFEEKQLHRIEAFIMPNNVPSLRLIERLSFGYEGVAKSFARINNTWTDHNHFALINPMHSSVPADTNNQNHLV